MSFSGDQIQVGSVVGGYRIDELISRGGMGVVYRVTNIALNRIYALKVLRPELAEDEQFRLRFRREMRIAASLHHPNIVGIHHAGEQEGMLFFVMDYVTGTDLREVLLMGGGMEPNRAIELLAQLTSALDAAHSRGLVHRDVKPANIMISIQEATEHAYLTDFGLAKKSDTASALTAQGHVVGTVDYMAPEQITGSHTDARTDIYALACVFFQMLTGKVPYERENSLATLYAHVHDPPPPLEGEMVEGYPAFAAVLEKALAKDPDDRYFSAGDFALDASAALRGTRDTSPPTIVAVGEATPVSSSTRPAPPTEAVAPGTEAAPPSAEPATPAEPAAPTEPPAEPTVLAGAGEATAASVPVEPTAMSDAGSPPPAAPSLPSAAPAPPPGPPEARRRSRLPLVAGLALIAGVIAAVIVLSSGGSSAGQPFASAANPVPTNRVTGHGSATVHLQGSQATVALTTSGLLNGSPHALHIHAGGRGVCPPASAARSHNGHHTISTHDGIKFYGPPEVSLTSAGDTSVKSIIDFSRYPAIGDVRYQRTITVPAGVAAAIRAGNAVIVVHGIDYNGNGIYDDVLDRSELSHNLPGEATSPALCGPLVSGSGSASAATGSHGVYTASLHRFGEVAAVRSGPARLLCHPRPSAATAGRQV